MKAFIKYEKKTQIGVFRCQCCGYYFHWYRNGVSHQLPGTGPGECSAHVCNDCRSPQVWIEPVDARENLNRPVDPVDALGAVFDRPVDLGNQQRERTRRERLADWQFFLESTGATL